MTAPRSPLLRLLTPPGELPARLTRVREPLGLGLPHRITLAAEVPLALVAPVGVARPWRDADPFATVASSAAQRAPWKAAKAEPPVAPPARLLVLDALGRAVLAQLPLVAGLQCRVASARGPLDLVVVGWELRVGTLRGAGEFGSWLELAWAPAGGSAEVYVEAAA